MTAAEKLIAVARAEIGYREKATNAELDSKTNNAGYGNWTKYADYFDRQQPRFYNGSKNGYAWCDVFVDWCHVQAFGADAARRLLCQPEKSLGAGVQFSRMYFRAAGQLHDLPRLGAQVFFGTAHTGIVSAVDGRKFSAIEGNTSGSSGVVADGGCVCEKTYTLQPGYHTFGWQDWGLVEPQKTAAINMPELRSGATGDAVRVLQALLNLWLDSRLDTDGEFGPLTKAAVLKYQQVNRLAADGIVGALTWASLLRE